MSTAVSPKRLLNFLSNTRSYPEHPRHLSVLQTHSSYVVLTTRHVYKVKKPVNFGFLDFSTLEKRRYFCEREVALNRRLCPGVHLGVVPISRGNGQLRFGADGEIVEYAVKMRRLPARFFMTHLVERGTITTRDVDAVVATLERFYDAQKPTPEIEKLGRVAQLRVSTDENFRQTEPFIGLTISRPAFEAIRLYTNVFYRRNSALFAERIRAGRILDCHGDLHLEHIHIRPARVTIYDCIEFNDRLRYIDVANDVAFLAMDFDFHERPDLARYFITQMARALADPAMLPLIDFYKCYRAYVRGKVESLNQADPRVPDAKREESRARAVRYFQLGLQYAICGSEPIVLIVMGRVGSGKSTLARALGQELGWKVFSSDYIRKELAGMPLYVRGEERERRELYGEWMTRKTYAALSRYAVEQYRQRRGVILDATFSNPLHRDALRKTLDGAGVAYCFIEAHATAATIQERLREREDSSDEVSDARIEDFPMLNDRYQPPNELGPRHLVRVKTARSPESAVTTVLKSLAKRHAYPEGSLGGG